MPFIENKYKNWYFSIIQHAKSRIDFDGYNEMHHILPRSMGGGDAKCNLVKLTGREHFICHILLTKMTDSNNRYKMLKALHMMMTMKNIGDRDKIFVNSRWYEYLRVESLNANKFFWTAERRAMHSKKAKEAAKKFREEFPEKYIEKNRKIATYARNKDWSELAIQTRLSNCLQAAASRKDKAWTNKRREAFNNSDYIVSAETKQKMSSANKGRQLSKGTTKAAWFLSPSNEEIFISPLKKLVALCGISFRSLKKLLTGKIAEYNGWKYLPGLPGEHLPSQSRIKSYPKLTKKRSGVKRITTEIIIDRSIEKHGNRYTYDRAEYVSCSTKMTITCRIHGDFFQTPDNHIHGNGCPKCKNENISKRFRKTLHSFIIHAGRVHNNFYSYIKSIYVNDKTKIEIICPKHGNFWQSPNSHLAGHGCIKCASSVKSNTGKK